MSEIKYWKDCCIHLDDQLLRIGNAWIERSWTFDVGRPVNLSIKDKKREEEWLAPEKRSALFEFPWFPASAKPDQISVIAFVEDDYGMSKPCMRTDVDMRYPERIVRLTIRLFPSAAFIRHEITVLPASSLRSAAEGVILQARIEPDSEAHSTQRTEFQLDDNNKQKATLQKDYCDRLDLQDLHCHWEAVHFRDQTDLNNNLVSKESGLLYVNEMRSLRGNVLFLKKTLHGCGLLVVKEGATPLGHLQDRGMDFQFRGKSLTVAGSGIGEGDLAQEEVTAYGTTVGVYDGNEYGGYRLLHDYHLCIRDYKPDRDCFIMSNTWGDRSKDSRINEEFMLGELQAASKLGIEILQIDDGWESGVTSNSVNAEAVGGRWSDYYSGESDFWSVNPHRFPQGLAPVVDLAKQYGIKVGLWYSPDASNDYVNWEKDVDTLLSLHRQYGILAFKLDGIDIRSKTGEHRLLNMMRHVTKATGGTVDFNLDATAQQRLGYFGKTQYGSIFLENRYTDWRNYYPHWTFRNLWNLAPYLPARKLQMEFLNVNRNQGGYADDPLAPAICGQVYAFATTSFANPLVWMELTGLDDHQAASLSAAIQALKPYRNEILGGHILPLGDEPSGTGWTGLQSVTSDCGGYLLIARERNETPVRRMKLWGIGSAPTGSDRSIPPPPILQLTELIRMDEKDRIAAGETNIPVKLKPDDHGEYAFSLPGPFTFAIYRYEI